jgi:hypothetical protein
MARRAATNVLTDEQAATVLLGLKRPGKTPTQAPGRQKYGARAVTIDGIRFASQAEARRYQALRQMERAGEITGLEPHPSFVMVVNGQKVGRFTADSRYTLVSTGQEIIEDVKSKPTREGEAYRLRKRLVEACHGITVTEYLERR